MSYIHGQIFSKNTKKGIKIYLSTWVYLKISINFVFIGYEKYLYNNMHIYRLLFCKTK